MYRGYILLDKTNTIKQRAIYVYLPTEEMVGAWKDRAKERKMSLSKFVVTTVEATVDTLGADAYKRDREILRELEALREDIAGVREELRQKNMLVGRLEGDLRAARLDLAERITKPVPKGEVVYAKRLVEVLMERRVLTNDELLAHLGIGFKDVKSIEAVRAQLDNLAEYGLVEYTGNSWRWEPRTTE